MGLAVDLELQEWPVPVEAALATDPVNLVTFARKAGKNIFSVMPEELLHTLYLRGPGNLHYVCDPEMITEILVGTGRDFPKSQFTRNVIGPAVGNGMILSEGAKWKAQRRRYSPLFAARNLPVLAQHFASTGLETAQRILSEPGEIDVADAAQEATLTDISRVMFSGTETVSPQEVRIAFRKFSDYIAHMSLFDLMGLPSWVPRAKWMVSRQPIRDVRKLSHDVISSRRSEHRDEPEDFLDLMIDALEEDFEDMDTTVDNLLTFVAGGYETTANTIAWGLYLLALYPGVQTAIRNEVRAACPEGPIPFEAVEKLPRLRAHIQETLRLYPAGALFARDASRDIVIKDVAFKKGDAIMLPIYCLHRNDLLWQHPKVYMADRFLQMKPRRGQYLPFGDGPRICIGAQYAETELTILMGSILRDVAFELSAHDVPLPNLTFTMRPGGPLILNAAPA